MTTLFQIIKYLNDNDCFFYYSLYRGEMAFQIGKAGRKVNMPVDEGDLLLSFDEFKLKVLDPALAAIHRRM